MTFAIESGATYDAHITGVPWPFGEGKIRSKLTEAGFKVLSVWKSGGEWYARATWLGESGTVEIDSHIDASSIVKVG